MEIAAVRGMRVTDHEIRTTDEMGTGQRHEVSDAGPGQPAPHEILIAFHLIAQPNEDRHAEGIAVMQVVVEMGRIQHKTVHAVVEPEAQEHDGDHDGAPSPFVVDIPVDGPIDDPSEEQCREEPVGLIHEEPLLIPLPHGDKEPRVSEAQCLEHPDDTGENDIRHDQCPHVLHQKGLKRLVEVGCVTVQQEERLHEEAGERRRRTPPSKVLNIKLLRPSFRAILSI